MNDRIAFIDVKRVLLKGSVNFLDVFFLEKGLEAFNMIPEGLKGSQLCCLDSKGGGMVKSFDHTRINLPNERNNWISQSFAVSDIFS